MKMNWWMVSQKLLNESSFFPSLFKWQELIVRVKDIGAIGSADTSTRNRCSHRFPNLFSSRFSPFFFFFFFSRGRTLFESALSPHGYNCCSVSWKKVSRKNRGRREQRGGPLFLPIFISFLFPGLHTAKRQILTTDSWYLIEKEGSGRISLFTWCIRRAINNNGDDDDDDDDDVTRWKSTMWFTDRESRSSRFPGSASEPRAHHRLDAFFEIRRRQIEGNTKETTIYTFLCTCPCSSYTTYVIFPVY